MHGDPLIYRMSLWGLLGLLFLGCAQQQKAISPEEKNLAQLSRLYGLYVSKNRGQPPADMAELKRFANSNSKGELASRGITATNLDDIFFSSRDKQEFGYLRPMSFVGAPGGGNESVVFYEKVGAAGKRYVGFSTPGKVEEVNELMFNELVPNLE
jgi:hypothetical protein